jgi:uncharacterized protein YndB with AHSA1/START domain
MTVGRVAPFSFDRSWGFAVSTERFWATVSDTREFPRWWGWLRSFESEGLVDGATTEFVVQGALRYQLHFVVRVDRVVATERVDTTVDGDLVGPASLELEPTDEGCTARLLWHLEPREPLLRRRSQLSHPLLTWSHDQVVAMGVAQFRRRLARAAA